MTAAQASVWIDNALAAARSTGYLPDAQGLRQAITDARAGMGTDAFGSRLEYEAAQLILANKLDAIGNVGDAQLTTDEQLLEQAKKEVDRLDVLIKAGRDALDEARGNTVAVRDVESAVRAFYDRLLEETGEEASGGSGAGGGKAPTRPGYGGVQGGSTWQYGMGYAKDPTRFQQEFNYGFGRSSMDVFDQAQIEKLTDLRAMLKAEYGAGSAEDLARIAAKAQAMGASTDEIGSALGFWGDDIRKIFADAGIPAFAAGGDHWGGVRLVGEDGPELEVTGAARIYNARQTQQLLAGLQGGGGDTAAVVAAIDGLRAMLYEALRSIYLTSSDSEKLLRRLEALGFKQRVEVPA